MIVKADLITLANEDILNSLSQFVYGIDFAEQEELNNKNIDVIFENFKNVNVEYQKLLTQTGEKRDERWRLMNFKLEKACYLISNLPKEYNLYNQFLVQDTHKDYFTVTLTTYAQGLLPYDKVDSLLNILSELKFYYKDIQKEYFILGCGFRDCSPPFEIQYPPSF